MKRDRRLHPLSWGHHHGLVFASRLSAATARPNADLGALVDQTRAFWDSDLRGHFAAEEALLVPAARASGDSCAKPIARMLEEHARFRALLQSAEAEPADSARSTALAEFAELLTAHIRFEERELFPQIENALSETAFERVGAALAEALPARTAPLPEM